MPPSWTVRCGTSKARRASASCCCCTSTLVIYRFQVVKQADVVLAMFLLGNEFSREQKERNFDYYDALTTGDSSLSASVQSIVAAEIGRDEQALEYFRHALLMDLADVAGNASDGVHIASAAGVWRPSCRASAGCATSTDGCRSIRGCREPGRRWSSRCAFATASCGSR